MSQYKYFCSAGYAGCNLYVEPLQVTALRNKGITRFICRNCAQLLRRN